MVFKKIRYNAGQDIFNIKILDSSGSFREKWVFMSCDFMQWSDIIAKKYGLKRINTNKDLDWAM